MTIEKLARIGSQRYKILIYLHNYRKFWHTERSISDGLGMALTMKQSSIARRLREGSEKKNGKIPTLHNRRIHGYVEYRWKGR